MEWQEVAPVEGQSHPTYSYAAPGKHLVVRFDPESVPVKWVLHFGEKLYTHYELEGALELGETLLRREMPQLFVEPVEAPKPKAGRPTKKPADPMEAMEMEAGIDTSEDVPSESADEGGDS